LEALDDILFFELNDLFDDTDISSFVELAFFPKDGVAPVSNLIFE
jgi:hypothetical protein